METIQQTPEYNPFEPPQREKMPTGAKIAIGCGIGCGVIILISIIAAIIFGVLVYRQLETREGPNPTTITQELVGDWNWHGSWYYTFNSDNTGSYPGGAINWWTESGILYICTTPGSCGTECALPHSWEYTFSTDGIELSLSGGFLNQTFHYTRVR